MTETNNRFKSFRELKENKYITFKLGREEYGVKILKVMEMIGGELEVTTIPNTPDYIKGVLNLRGKIIPIIDLRIKFGLEPKDYGDRTSIIILEIDMNDVKTPVGTVVDSITEVLQIEPKNIENTPKFGSDIDTHYILGMAKVKDKVKILLDIDKVLSGEEVNILNDMGEKTKI